MWQVSLVNINMSIFKIRKLYCCFMLLCHWTPLQPFWFPLIQWERTLQVLRQWKNGYRRNWLSSPLPSPHILWYEAYSKKAKKYPVFSHDSFHIVGLILSPFPSCLPPYLKSARLSYYRLKGRVPSPAQDRIVMVWFFFNKLARPCRLEIYKNAGLVCRLKLARQVPTHKALPC